MKGPRKNAMIFTGGYPGHEPDKVSKWMEALLIEEGYTVDIFTDLDCLDDASSLANYDVISPLYFMGEMSEERTMNLIKAVSEFGCSLIGFHGTADGFRGNVKYNMLTGAQFAGHPLGKMTEYTVITDSRLGVPTFKVVTEQLFLMVSPAAEVLAYSEFKPKSHPYFLNIEKPIKMPVVFKYRFGKGSVFYCSLGHNYEFIESCPQLREIMRFGIKQSEKEE